jgi:hypothetical protein
MKIKEPTELGKLAEMLQDRYGSGNHYEIRKAEKTTLGWVLEIRQIFEDDEETAGASENEGAENESNK